MGGCLGTAEAVAFRRPIELVSCIDPIREFPLQGAIVSV
jgi:hypothetical protein